MAPGRCSADFTGSRCRRALPTWRTTLTLEDRLFADLQDEVYDAGPSRPTGSPFNRYNAGSRSDPGHLAGQLEPYLPPEAGAGGARTRGAALLLHGLTDSPYSLRSIGEHLAARTGFEVVGLRLPGSRHGAVRPAQRSASRTCRRRCGSRCATCAGRCGPDQPLYMVGYSNGAALAVDYTLSVLDGEVLPMAGRPRARVAGDRRSRGSPSSAGSGPGSRRCPASSEPRGRSIETEFDPYKYNVVQLQRGRRDLPPHDAASPGAVERLARRPADCTASRPCWRSSPRSTRRCVAEAVVDALLEHLAPGRPRARAVRREPLCRACSRCW
ncbi:MAG: hypothetical protein MZV70_43160 [Desulfobacterales bacterium]|nr:hypothetical protein [Desulfobacterales bacterium]